MPLIKCKVCENMISANAEVCPHCGEKYQKSSKLIIHRKAAFTGLAVRMEILIDGVLTGSLRTDESVILELSFGNHVITASASGGWKGTTPIVVLPEKTYNIDVRFKPFGADFQINEVDV